MGVSGAGVVDAASLGDALNGFIKVAIELLIFEGALHLNREELGRAPRAVWCPRTGRWKPRRRPLRRRAL